MKNLIKLGVASALALGSTMAAHASITVPTSSNPGNMLLFANVYNSSGTVVNAYAGDTGISVTALSAATSEATYTDANLNTLLGQAAAAGNTVIWTIEGAGGLPNGSNSPIVIASNSSVYSPTNPFGPQSGNSLSDAGTGMTTQANGLEGRTQSLPPGTTSFLSTNIGSASLGGTGYSPLTTTNDAHNLYGIGTDLATTGLGTSVGIYQALAATTAVASIPTYSELFTAELTSAGVVFSAVGGSEVPIPAAVWLLGSGLLGLAGVARRKSSDGALGGQFGAV